MANKYIKRSSILLVSFKYKLAALGYILKVLGLQLLEILLVLICHSHLKDKFITINNRGHPKNLDTNGN